MPFSNPKPRKSSLLAKFKSGKGSSRYDTGWVRRTALPALNMKLKSSRPCSWDGRAGRCTTQEIPAWKFPATAKGDATTCTSYIEIQRNNGSDSRPLAIWVLAAGVPLGEKLDGSQNKIF
jgi:hypothetical protein